MENLVESCATIQIVNKFKIFLNIKNKIHQKLKKIQSFFYISIYLKIYCKW